MMIERDRAGAGDGPHASARCRVAFLFFGELFLIPHLLPIAVALSRREDAPEINLFVISSVHEEIILDALAHLGIASITVRRARGFRQFPAGRRDTPHLPWKLQILARNARAIMGHDAVVVAERTSLWLPRLARGRGPAFVYNEHGAGPHANFASPRNRAAACILMPGEGMATRFRECGNEAVRVAVVGYIKRDYIREISGSGGKPLFPEQRPTVVYVPHWLRHKSSWWDMGEQVLDYFAASTTYNLILAPHIRLPEFVPEFDALVARFRDCRNIHIDATSFRLVDQSYINSADIYLGDGSSQVVEFAETPRPAIFLNPQDHDWSNDPRFSHWSMGDVVHDIPGLDRALSEADEHHRQRYASVQKHYVDCMMGSETGDASVKAAEAVHIAALERRGPRTSGDVIAFPNGRGLRILPSSWMRAAAIVALVGSGWLAHDVTGGLVQPAHAASFVDEASASFTASLARQQMISQIGSTRLDRAKILRATGLSLPALPRDWQVKDVQAYPTDTGMAIAVVMQTDRKELLSLFAAKAETPAEKVPLLANRHGRSVAYWEAGPMAYALTSDLASARLLALAAKVAEPNSPE